MPPVILTVGGFDPSSGAGVTADIKTIASHGCFGVSCITALTVQNTKGVSKVEPVNPGTLNQSLKALASDMHLAAVHIGMLGSGEVAAVVADFLKANQLGNVVVDPVLRSSSGAVLLDDSGVQVLREQILPMAAVITPNVDEAAALTGIAIRGLQGMQKAADRFHSLGVASVVVTGGHLDPAADLLSVAVNGAVRRKMFTGKHLDLKSTHGTGCAFATALACELAFGQKIQAAVSAAKKYVRSAIEGAYPIGKGVGPVNHFASIRLQGRGKH